jgi:hypothetical protein
MALRRLSIFIILVLLAGCATSAPLPAVWSPTNPAGAAPVSTVQTNSSGQNDLPSPQTQNQSLPSATLPAPATLPDIPNDVNPLTGLHVSDPSLLNRRPVMVKVSNYPTVGRPHAGLSYADMVFEYYIGYGYNRFLAVYLGQDASLVGPVRSGRLVDAQLAELYQSILFYGNADAQVDDVLLKELGPRALAEKYIPSPPKYRIEGDPVEITLFTNTKELSDYYTHLNPNSNGKRDLRGMFFSNDIHPINEPGDFVGVQFGRQARGEWHYNKDSGLYERWIENNPGESGPIPMIPLVDRLNNRQLAFDNVILVFATYTEFAPTLHNVALFDQNAGKRAVFFRDGVKIEGTWKTASNGMPLQFFNSWGLPMNLKPGTSWIVLVGETSKLTSPAPGQWELRFDIP